jgi:hypothetical protein
MKIKIILLLLCNLFLSMAAKAEPIEQQPGNTQTAEQWREDLHYLALAVTNGHPDPFTKVSKTEFETAVSTLDKNIPKLKRNEIIVEMAKILASIKDGHSALGFVWDDEIAFRRLPLRFYLFSDGLFVQSATAEYERLLGAKVLRIGNLSTEQAIMRARPIIHGENEMAFKDIVPSRLTMP